MNSRALRWFRQLPRFKGKLRIGKILFKDFIENNDPVSFYAHGDVFYKIPNTRENIGVELLLNGVYEQDIVHFLKKQVPDKAIFFDVGANIGSIGLPVLKMKKEIRYFGFEASPLTFIYLKENFVKNEIAHYELHNKLVHRDDAQVLNFYQSDLYGKSSLAPTYSNEFIIVESLSLDSFCHQKKIERIDWMKVDVQGFEIYVFEGMKRLLQNKMIGNILFEFEPWAEEQAKVQIGVAKDFIKDMGYELYTLDNRNWESYNRKNDTMIWAKPK